MENSAGFPPKHFIVLDLKLFARLRCVCVCVARQRIPAKDTSFPPRQGSSPVEVGGCSIFWFDRDPETNSKQHLKIGQAPKGKDRLLHFQCIC